MAAGRSQGAARYQHANKCELVADEASIAATGIWLADDERVMNPATVFGWSPARSSKGAGFLRPHAVKAPGNSGYPAQLVLSDLRARIRGALLADRSGRTQRQHDGDRGAGTLAQTARLLGATYGRLQAEL